jgi:hypothetical protein
MDRASSTQAVRESTRRQLQLAGLAVAAISVIGMVTLALVPVRTECGRVVPVGVMADTIALKRHCGNPPYIRVSWALALGVVGIAASEVLYRAGRQRGGRKRPRGGAALTTSLVLVELVLIGELIAVAVVLLRHGELPEAGTSGQ